MVEFTILGADKKNVWMRMRLGGWGICEGFGKRCGVGAIRGSVGLGADFLKSPVIGRIYWRRGKS